MSTRIYSVDCIDLTLQKSNPPNLQILCMGRVTTSGWSNPRLEPFIYVTPPKDGIQEFDAVATPPDAGTVVLNVLTPVTAETTIPGIDIANFWGPGWPLKGIRCHTTSNSKTVGLGEAVPGMPKMREIKEGGGAATVPGYEVDIRPLFRLRDVAVMKQIRRLPLSRVRSRQGMGTARQGPHLRVCRLPPADFGDGRNDPARRQAAAYRPVLGCRPDGDPFQRHLRPATPETARYRLVPKRLAARPQAACCDGRPRVQPVVGPGRDRRGQPSLPNRRRSPHRRAGAQP